LSYEDQLILAKIMNCRNMVLRREREMGLQGREKKILIGGGMGIVLLIGVMAILKVLDKPEPPTYPPVKPEEATVQNEPSEVAPLPPPPPPPKTVKQKPASTVTVKITRETSDSNGPDKERESLPELEQIFDFIHEAMATMPSLIEVDVHEPGVVFFRHKPDRPEALELAMQDLAYLYKERFAYDKPVNVVFFISGRPVKSKVFFRE
jgi:hypothetical protein